MFRKEIPMPIFIGIIILVLLVVAVLFGRHLLGGPRMVTLEQLPPELQKWMVPLPPTPGQQTPTKP